MTARTGNRAQGSASREPGGVQSSQGTTGMPGNPREAVRTSARGRVLRSDRIGVMREQRGSWRREWMNAVGSREGTTRRDGRAVTLISVEGVVERDGLVRRRELQAGWAVGFRGERICMEGEGGNSDRR